MVEGDIDEEIINVVQFHHERIDGLGYPFGLKGDEILFLPRLLNHRLLRQHAIESSVPQGNHSFKGKGRTFEMV